MPPIFLPAARGWVAKQSTQLASNAIKSSQSIKSEQNQATPTKINQIQTKSIKSKQNQSNPNKINQVQTKT